MQWDKWLQKIIRDVSQEYCLSKQQTKRLWNDILERINLER